MNDSSRISASFSRSKQSFINLMNKSDKGNSNFDSVDLNWKEPLIPKRNEKYLNTHYLCPKCFHFPLIDFISKEYIYYECFCPDSSKKLVKIKRLFAKDEKYMTFSDNIILNNSSITSQDKIKGFKCSKKHYSGKNGKFRFYCTVCEENICSECIRNHMHDMEKLHELIVLDFQAIKNYRYVEFINNKLKKENVGYRDQSSDLDESFDETQNKANRIIPVENKAIFVEKEDEDEFNYFNEFINIILNDYIDFPNYYHTYNIESIFRFLNKKHNFGIKIKYINQKDKNIRLFGTQFVENNKNKLSIIIEDLKEHIEYIKEFHQFNSDKKSLEIYLTDKNIDPINNYYGCFNISHMFQECDSLYEIEFDIKNCSFHEDLSHLFDGCKSLQEIPDSILDWINFGANDLSYMFHNCSSLKIIPDISVWKLSNLLQMNGLFKGCKSLISLPDISNWDTKFVTDMSYMFSCCTNLKALPDISKWNTENVNNLSYMFSNCSALVSIPDLSKWNINKVYDINGMFENCFCLKNLEFFLQWENKIKDNNKNNKILLKEFNIKYNSNITDTKIKKLNLVYKNLGNEGLNDLSKTKFRELKEIYLSYDKISDIKGLENFEFDKLEILNLSSNNILNINLLEKLNCKELKELNLSQNKISDIKILEKVIFKKLENLDLRYNNLLDINIFEKVKFDNLKELNLSQNKISDINVLEKVKFNKLEILNLGFNHISNIDVFGKVKFEELKQLNLYFNKISNINILEKVKFSKLEILNLGGNQIIIINILEKANFKELKQLNLSGNDISNIKVLDKVKFNKLKILYLSKNRISDINILEKVNFKELKELYLYDNKISDIRALENVNFEKIEILHFGINQISNINVLEKVNFKELKKLNLSQNNITDIKVLEKVQFDKLEILNICKNKISEKENETIISKIKSTIKKFYI